MRSRTPSSTPRSRARTRLLVLALLAGAAGFSPVMAQAAGDQLVQGGNLPFRSGAEDGPIFRDPRADQVLESMIEAHGGSDSIAGRSSIYIKYRITNYSGPEPMTGTITVWFRRPWLMRKEIEYPRSKQVVIYDGESAWVDRGKGPEVLGPVASSIVRRGLQEFDSPLIYRQGSLKYLSVAKDPRGRLTQKLSWRHEGYARDLMVDSETYRLLVVGSFDTPAGAISKMQVFDDYRDVEGMLVPHRKEIYTNNQRNSETEVIEVRFNEELAMDIFSPAGGQALSSAGSELSSTTASRD